MTEPTSAAAPATPAAAAKAPPPSALASSFDARIALAKSLGSPRVADDKPAAAAASTPGENVDEAPAESDTATPAPETEEAPDSADTEGDETDEAEPAPVPGTDAEKLSTGLALMQKGDLDAAVRALGGDPKLIPLPTKKAFRAMARREMKAQARDTQFARAKATAQSELSTESNRLSQLQRGLATKFAAADESQRAWENEDFLTVGKALERHFKTDLATITQKLASGKVGKTPDEKGIADERAKLARERAEWEAQKANESSQKTLAQKRQEAVTRVGAGLKAHPYIVGVDGKPDPDAIEEVFNAYEKTWDGEKFTKTAKACADELQQKLEERAKKRGLVKAGALSTKNGKPGAKPVVAARPRLPEPARTTPRTNLGTTEDLDASRALRLANARRITEQQRRGLR